MTPRLIKQTLDTTLSYYHQLCLSVLDDHQAGLISHTKSPHHHQPTLFVLSTPPPPQQCTREDTNEGVPTADPDYRDLRQREVHHSFLPSPLLCIVCVSSSFQGNHVILAGSSRESSWHGHLRQSSWQDGMFESSLQGHL